MIYKWKTWVQDIPNDPEALESLDEDITEICVKGGWEVWQMNYVNFMLDGEPVTQRVITLRSEITGPITHQSVPMEHILRLKALRERVWVGATNAPDHHAYTTALQNFFLEAEELLGLK